MALQQPFTLLGNSLGGHVALVYTLHNPQQVQRLVLTGSSGLFEDSMGSSFPKRGNYGFVQQRVAYTFYDPSLAMLHGAAAFQPFGKACEGGANQR